jgi:hypothetical protein
VVLGDHVNSDGRPSTRLAVRPVARGVPAAAIVEDPGGANTRATRSTAPPS